MLKNNTDYETILTFTINKTRLWDSAFIKMEIVCRNFATRQLLATWGFSALEGKHTTKASQAVNSLRQ